MTSMNLDPFTDVIGYFYLSVSDSDTIQCNVEDTVNWKFH